MTEAQRQQINALGVVSWRTLRIETMSKSLDRQLSRPSGYSADKASELHEEIEMHERSRAAAVRYLATTDIKTVTLPRSAPLEFLDETQRCGLLPLPELLRLVRRGALSNPYFALAAAGKIADELAEALPDGDGDLEVLIDFAEDVCEVFQSVARERSGFSRH